MYGFTTDDEYSKKIFKLPPIPTLLISTPSFALVIYVLAKKVENTAISYAAYEEMYHNLYELIVSDIMMPEIDGFEFAQSVRQVNKTIPILFMSARDDLPSKQKGFQLGIDDYMVKPIELDELLLRVRALLRRANIEMERKITIGNLVLDADGMSVEIDGEEVSLTTREFNIIYKLLSYPKKTFSRAQLMDEFWGVESDTSLRAVIFLFMCLPFIR